MPIIAITQQPGSGVAPKIVAAYRPIIFLVNATRTDGQQIPPVVYCDIYFNGTYYKSLSLTQFNKLNAGSTEWKFDVGDAAQEYLRFNLPINGSGNIQEAPQSVVAVFCRFRSSGFDGNGFLLWEGIAPKQATGSTAAIAGTGSESHSFYIINAVLQHEANQDLLTHLQYSRPNGNFNVDTFPLTHRPNRYRLCPGDSDYFPFLHLGNKALKTICITYRLKGETAFQTTCYVPPAVCNSVVSNVVCTVMAGNNVLVTFQSVGDATIWEWSLLPTTQWHVINEKNFIISWNEFLQAIITEAGLPVVTENGQIIIPEEVDPYAPQTVEVRPRCPNGAYGTPGSGNFTILPPGVCDPPIEFSFNSVDYVNSLIKLNTSLPGGATHIEIEIRLDHGNGVITPAVIFSGEVTGGLILYDNSSPEVKGTYKFRIRTVCDPVNGIKSAWSNVVDAAWNPPSNVIVAQVISVVPVPGSQYLVTVGFSQATVDNVLVQGHFLGDAAGGNDATIEEISNTALPGGYRAQVFEVGPNVSAGNIFTMSVYNHPVSYTAVPGDTRETIVSRLILAINGTSPSQWNSAGVAPTPPKNGFPPIADDVAGQPGRISVRLDQNNSFGASVYGGGGVATFNFNIVVIAGNTQGTALLNGAGSGGSTYNWVIDHIEPDPTSDGFDIQY